MIEDRAAKKRARDDLNSIAELRKTPAYTNYFVRKVTEELKKREEMILTNRDLTPQQLYEERLRYFAVLDTSRLIEMDEAACRKIIGDAGQDD